MGRRKNNPELVEKLMKSYVNRPERKSWDSFDKQLDSLSSSDRKEVEDFMEQQNILFGYDEDDEDYEDDEDDEYDERLSASDAADIWMSRGKDEDYTFGYSDDELEEASNRSTGFFGSLFGRKRKKK